MKVRLGNMDYSKKEYLMVKYLMNKIRKGLWKEHPKLKLIDSNLYHFMIGEMVRKQPKTLGFLTRGWFVHGIYFPIIDDILVYEEGQDKEKIHQLDGNEKMLKRMIYCDCHD